MIRKIASCRGNICWYTTIHRYIPCVLHAAHYTLVPCPVNMLDAYTALIINVACPINMYLMPCLSTSGETITFMYTTVSNAYTYRRITEIAYREIAQCPVK